MIGRGYSRRLSFGITAAGATLGILIPPSIPMIIYGSTVGAPIDKLFLAGIVPGLLLALLMMVLAFGWVVLVAGGCGAARPALQRWPRSCARRSTCCLSWR